MKVFKRLLGDATLWLLLLTCFFGWRYSHYAENILSFYGIFLLVLGMICLFCINKVAEIKVRDSQYKPRGTVYNLYARTTTLLEISIVAAMGWYWVTAGFLIYSIVILSSLDEADKLYREANK
ncbi:hypothetical protein NFB56_16150 [Yersinia ruckeri]|uniref:hypothetical protein n=1 Tax=Yersinia ruckeri TaxID=29486 RepID=UPI002238FB54|nr:hypothetical protein [Yersinia ruckeri]MCW6550371.1 hypothetical protein [Yersinia ruckeri]